MSTPPPGSGPRDLGSEGVPAGSSYSPKPKLIERTITETIVSLMREARAVALLGPRQAGKSTLARLLAQTELHADYVTLDDLPDRTLALSDPHGFLAGLRRPAVIDEVQRAPELLLAIKSQLDLDAAPGQFLLTGSANLRSIPTVADALPGRVDYLTLWPFTQGELVGRREQLIAQLFAGDAPRITDAPVGRGPYTQTLLRGGFPESRLRSETTRSSFFESYVTTIVERDVADTSRVRNPRLVGSLLRLLAARSGSLAHYETLARELDLDGKTVKSYVQVLERLFLVRVRQPWHVNLGKRHVKMPKIYLVDSGLLAALTGVNERRLSSDAGLAGALFETFVAVELERQASWSAEPLTFWHYREGQREVDVVIERPSGEVIAVEVKASATVRAADFAGLIHMRDRIGARLRAGVVLYAGSRTVPFGKGLWAMPLCALWRA